MFSPVYLLFGVWLGVLWSGCMCVFVYVRASLCVSWAGNDVSSCSRFPHSHCQSDTGCTMSLSLAKYPFRHWISHTKKSSQTMCVLFIYSPARIFIIFCWMARKHKSSEKNWLSPTATLYSGLSILCIVDTAATGCSEMIKSFAMKRPPSHFSTATDSQTPC